MPTCEITLRAGEPANATPVTHAWVYWRVGGNTTLLRSDGAGLLFAMFAGGTRDNLGDYGERFRVATGTNVDLYFSRGAKPIPDAVLAQHAAAFHARTVALGAGAQPAIVVNANNPNAVAVLPRAELTIPDLLLELGTPAELSLWPVLWELPTRDYEIAGLNQGAALWTNPAAPGNLTVAENGPAAAPPAANRPRERGLRVAGRIDARATGARIQVLDANGAAVQLRPGIAPGGAVAELPATLGAVNAGFKSLTATVFFANAADAFGPVQILVRSDGMAPPILDAFAVHLCGMQLALVDDHAANQNGQQRGPIRNEADETIILDFLSSPQANTAAISAETRARRMVAYRFANHTRLLRSADPPGPTNPDVLTPQMPLWMGELQLVGVEERTLRDLLLHRHLRLHHGTMPSEPPTTTLELEWTLALSYDGPDVNAAALLPNNLRPNQAYSYSQSFSGDARVVLRFGARGQLTDAAGQTLALAADGAVPDAFDPPRPALTFPVQNRRAPQVLLSSGGTHRRPWGRQAGAAQKDVFVIEIQPSITDAGRELIRGGDGKLELRALRIDGIPLDGGLVPDAAGVLAPPPAGTPPLRLPTFRIRGLNPAPHASVTALIHALVQEYVDAHAAQPHVALLTLAQWQTTITRIFEHENGGDRQFENRGAGRRNAPHPPPGLRFGHDEDMPYFGGPHGYGFAQLDNPPVTDDGAWSFIENMRAGIRLVIGSKAPGARTFLTAGGIPANAAGAAAFAALPLQHRRAIYQREIVRRYNGGREFRFVGGAWVVQPAGTPRHQYPNNVLGTALVYPGPTPFNAADFGPGI